MLNWQEGLTTGVPDLDNHHREIFQKFNEFYVAISGTAAARREEAGKVLDCLHFYSQLNFKRAEELMENYHCPAAEENNRRPDGALETRQVYNRTTNNHLLTGRAR